VHAAAHELGQKEEPKEAASTKRSNQSQLSTRPDRTSQLSRPEQPFSFVPSGVHRTQPIQSNRRPWARPRPAAAIFLRPRACRDSDPVGAGHNHPVARRRRRRGQAGGRTHLTKGRHHHAPTQPAALSLSLAHRAAGTNRASVLLQPPPRRAPTACLVEALPARGGVSAAMFPAAVAPFPIDCSGSALCLRGTVGFVPGPRRFH
jgi:hypothetical protein